MDIVQKRNVCTNVPSLQTCRKLLVNSFIKKLQYICIFRGHFPLKYFHSFQFIFVHKEAAFFSINTIQDPAAYNKMPLNFCRTHAVITPLYVTYFGHVMNRLSRESKENKI
jgi:hypothetical protein